MGLVGMLAKDELDDFGLIQLSQPPLGPVLLQPIVMKHGKHTRLARNQVRQFKITRMANSSFLEQVGDVLRNGPITRNLSAVNWWPGRRADKAITTTLLLMAFIRLRLPEWTS